MEMRSTDIKIKARLKMVAIDRYEFQVQIENLELKEWQSDAKPIQLSIKKKSRKSGSGLKLQLVLHKNKGIKKNLEKGIPYRTKGLEVKITGPNHFAIKLTFNIFGKQQKNFCMSTTDAAENQHFILNNSSTKLYRTSGQYTYTTSEIEKTKAKFHEEIREGRLDEAATTAKKEEQDKLLIEKGIRKSSATSFRNCENCYYYRKRYCGLMSLPVKEFNTCKRFYAPKIKIYSGGSFSSK